MSKYSVAVDPTADETITELGLVSDACPPHDAINAAVADKARSEAITLGEDIFTPDNRGSSRRLFQRPERQEVNHELKGPESVHFQRRCQALRSAAGDLGER
jgi:hypothetical protein